MKRLLTGMFVAALLCALAYPVTAQLRGKDPTTQPRSLQGSVMGKQDAPLEKAVVYLKNTKTLNVRSYIVGPDGKYQFNSLAPNIDYEVHAEYEGEKSDTKTLNGFDTRPKAQINLRIGIDPKK